MSLGPATELPCSKSELDVFQPVNVQVALIEGRWHTYQPLQTISSPPDIVEFIIPGTANETVDLNNISVYIKGKFVNIADGANLTAAKFGVANNLLGSMFHHIDLTINGQLITRASRDYAYKDYLTKLLYYNMPQNGKEGKQNTCIGWYPDEATDIKNANSNDGWKYRREAYTEESKMFELQGPVGIDLLNCDRLLLPGTDLHLKFHFNDAKFFMMNATETDTAKLQISKMELNVRRVTVGDSFVNELNSQLQDGDAIYPFVRREIHSFGIGKGETGITKENLFRGQLATRYFACLVLSKAFNGTSWVENPYNFDDFGLNEIAIMENGQTIAGQPIKVNFKTANLETMKAYYQLLETIGAIGERALQTPITKAEFDDHCAIFAFTRSPDLCHGDAALPNQIGNVNCQLTFATALPNPVTCIIMAEFDARVQIGKDKSLSTDYAS